VERLGGATRYETAKKISEVVGITDATDRLIIVNGEEGKWADALSAGPIAAQNEWPIVLTNSTGLEASAKAIVDAYLAKPGSSKLFMIIGGPASVSTSVEEYLIGTKLVAPANVRRVAGADRYQTNFLVNNWILGESGFNWGGASLALASGEVPFDALVSAAWLAKTNTHLVLTPAAGGNANVATLAGVLNLFSEQGANSSLWVLGGRTAVSDAARLGYIGAASAEDLTATLSDCVVGSPYATLTLSGRMTAAEYNAVSVAASLVTKNVATVDQLASISDAAGPGDTTRLVFDVEFATVSALGDSIKFNGLTEGSTVSGTTYVPKRSIASTSCTPALDTTRPTVTVRALTGNTSGATTTTSAGAMILVSASELVSLGANGSVSAGSLVLGGVDTTQVATVSALGTPLGGFARAGNYATRWLIQLSPTETATLSASAPYSTVTLKAATVSDTSGNTLADDVTVSSAPDATGPVLTAAGVTCAQGTEGSWTSGGLTLTAVDQKSLNGAIANQYTMSVVNQRGKLQPSIVIDSTAKSIVVTLDAGYHTANDVATALRNSGIDSVVATAGTAALTTSPTLTPAVSLTGDHTCQVLVVGDEPHTLNTGFTVSVGGLSAGYVSGATTSASSAALTTGNANVARWGRVISFTTKVLGAASIGFDGSVNGLSNIKGVAGATPVTFTAS
jgi:hypothetical protein